VTNDGHGDHPPSLDLGVEAGLLGLVGLRIQRLVGLGVERLVGDALRLPLRSPRVRKLGP